MGFDLTGRQPKNKKGEYFRNNCWHWRPLATYVLNLIELPEKQQNWEFNDGCKVSKISAEKIAKKLQQEIDSGNTTKYSKKYKADLKKLPLEKCHFCKGTKKYQNKKCSFCKNTGKQESWLKNYPFSVENVKEFIEFAKNSGGFKIY